MRDTSDVTNKRQESEGVIRYISTDRLITLITLIFRIIITGIVCLVISITIDYFIFKPSIGFLNLSIELTRMIRYSLDFFVLLVTYVVFIKCYEKRIVWEFSSKSLFFDFLVGFWGAFACFSLIICIFFLGNFYSVTGIQLSFQNLIFPFVILMLWSTLEEIMYRGILYRIIEERCGTYPALFCSSLLFGLAHLLNDNANYAAAISTGLGGLLLGIQFNIFKRLWFPIFFHLGWNYTQVFWGMTVSGVDELIPYSIINSRLDGPVWLTGGDFGPENSIITMILTCILFLMFFYWARRRNSIRKTQYVRLKPNQII